MTVSQSQSDAEGRLARGLAATHSIPELIVRVFRDTSDLYRKEAELLRAEVSEKVDQAKGGVGKIVSGAIVLLVSLVVLSQALVSGVANIITAATAPVAESSAADIVSANTGWAQLIVGVLFALIGAFMVRSGSADLSAGNLTPERTAEQMRRDTELAKEQMR